MIYLLFTLVVLALICMAFVIGVLLVALDRDRSERHDLSERLVNALLANESEAPAEAMTALERVREPEVPAGVTEDFLTRERLARRTPAREAAPPPDMGGARPIGAGG